MANQQRKVFKGPEKAILYQNNPNPYDVNTQIKFYIPIEIKSASIQITDISGKRLKEIPIPSKEKDQ